MTDNVEVIKEVKKKKERIGFIGKLSELSQGRSTIT